MHENYEIMRANNIKTVHLDRESENGASLIGMAMVIMMIGLMVAGASVLYKNYDQITANQDTVDRNLIIRNAIKEFVSRNGRYPCPAPLNAPPDSIRYGREDSTPAASPPACDSASYYNEAGIRGAGPVLAPPSVSRGIYITPGRATTGNIIIGAIPTRSLNISDDNMYDGHGMRYIYVITARMASPGYDVSHDIGGIEIQDENGQSLSSTPGHVAYSFFSPGIDRRGAYNYEGVVIESCDTSTDAGENCDNDNVFSAALLKRY